MSFNLSSARHTLAASLVATLLSLTACKIEIGEAPETPPPAPSQAACLDGSMALMTRYLNGESNPQELSAFWDCSIKVLKLFQTSSRGIEDGRFSGVQLRRFITRYFLTDFKITDDLLAESMALKRSILGGSSQEIGAHEFERTYAILDVLKSVTLKLQPYFPLEFKALSKRSPSELQKLRLALVDAANQLGTQLEQEPINYAFMRLDGLLNALLDTLPASEGRDAFQTLRKRIPLLAAMKRIIVSPEQIPLQQSSLIEVDGIAQKDIKRLLVLGARGFVAGVEIYRLVDTEESWLVGRGREGLMDLLGEWREIMLDAIAHHPNQKITVAEFERLVSSLLPGDLGQIKVVNLRNLVRPLITGMMAGPDFSAAGRQGDGLSQQILERLWHILQEWNEGQRIVESIFVKLNNGAIRAEELLAYPVATPILVEELNHYRVDGSPEQVRLTTTALANVRYILENLRPLFQGSEPRVYFSGNRSKLRQHSLYNLTSMNWMRLASAMMIEGFAEDQERAGGRVGLNFQELGAMIRSLKPLLEDLRIIEPNLKGLEIRRFREMALFTFSSDGGDYINLDEGTYYLATVVSAIQQADDMYKDWVQFCSYPGQYDYYGNLYLKPSCVKRRFAQKYDLYLSQLPHMLSYLESITEEKRLEFADALNMSGMMDSGENDRTTSYIAEGYASTLHYVETIFSRFDNNDSGTIDQIEEREAFPVFRCALARIPDDELSPHMLESLFTYLLAFGKAPKENSRGDPTLLAKLGLGAWSLLGHISAWPLHTERTKLLSIFAALSEMSSKSAVEEAYTAAGEPSLEADNEEFRLRPCVTVNDGVSNR